MSLHVLTAAMPRMSSPPRAPAQFLPDQARTTRVQYGEPHAQFIACRRAGSRAPPGRIVDKE